MSLNINGLSFQGNLLNEEAQMLQEEMSMLSNMESAMGLGGFGGQDPQSLLNGGLQDPSGQCRPYHHHHHHHRQTNQPLSNTTTYSNGQTSLDLGDGYTLSLNKSNSQWTLTNQATGETTNVSGDPHVSENGNTWTFKNNTTFQLADGTQITVKTTPAGNGQTLSDELDITRGGSSIQVTGLASNDPNQLQVTQGSNGYQLAASNWGDNTVYEFGGEWMGENGQAVNQSYVNNYNL